MDKLIQKGATPPPSPSQMVDVSDQNNTSVLNSTVIVLHSQKVLSFDEI